MKYNSRDKIGAFIWSLAFMLAVFLCLGITFSPVIVTALDFISLPLWAIIVSMLFLYFLMFWFSTIVQNWLELFENWLREKLNL